MKTTLTSVAIKLNLKNLNFLMQLDKKRFSKMAVAMAEDTSESLQCQD